MVFFGKPARSEQGVSEAQISALLRGMELPPCPSVLAELSLEMRKEQPHPLRVMQLIGSDVALSAGVLKIANSPPFSLGKPLTSIAEALALLGMRQIFSLVINELLRKTLVLGDEPLPDLDTFWDGAASSARVCSELARMLPGTTPDMAYTFGLFHDCGIPILLRRFPSYRDTLRQPLDGGRPLTSIEDAAHGTNHAVVGYLMAKSWGLPEPVVRGIGAHHDYAVFEHDSSLPQEALTLIALNLIAERVVQQLFDGPDEHDWGRGRSGAARFFGFPREELDDLVEDMVSLLRRIARR